MTCLWITGILHDRPHRSALLLIIRLKESYADTPVALTIFINHTFEIYFYFLGFTRNKG